MKKRLIKILWSCTLVVVFALLVNNTVFIHSHILPDGRVVQHAHPFNSSGEKSGSQPNHKHTAKELMLLSYIYDLFSNSTCPIILIILLFKYSFLYNPLHVLAFFPFINQNVKSPRAPPVLLLSPNSCISLTNVQKFNSWSNSNEKYFFVYSTIPFY